MALPLCGTLTGGLPLLLLLQEPLLLAVVLPCRRSCPATPLASAITAPSAALCSTLPFPCPFPQYVAEALGHPVYQLPAHLTR